MHLPPSKEMITLSITKRIHIHLCIVHPPLLGTSLFKVKEKARAGHFLVCKVIGKYEELLHET